MEMKTGCRPGVEAGGGPETVCVCSWGSRRGCGCGALLSRRVGTFGVGLVAVSVRVDVKKFNMMAKVSTLSSKEEVIHCREL